MFSPGIYIFYSLHWHILTSLLDFKTRSFLTVSPTNIDRDFYLRFAVSYRLLVRVILDQTNTCIAAYNESYSNAWWMNLPQKYYGRKTQPTKTSFCQLTACTGTMRQIGKTITPSVKYTFSRSNTFFPERNFFVDKTEDYPNEKCSEQCTGKTDKVHRLDILQRYSSKMVLVDGTVHGDGYITPIVIVCKVYK